MIDDIGINISPINGSKIPDTKTTIYTTMNNNRNMLPEHVLLLVITGDTVGQDIAEYYCSARGVSTDNILNIPVTIPTTNIRFSDADELTLITDVRAKLTAVKTIKCITLCGHWPNLASTGFGTFSGYSNCSLPSRLMMPFEDIDGIMGAEDNYNSISSIGFNLSRDYYDFTVRDSDGYLFYYVNIFELPDTSLWETGKFYDVGDICYSASSLALGYVIINSVAGTSSTEPVVVGYTPGPTGIDYGDGLKWWTLSSFNSLHPDFPLDYKVRPYNFRLPTNHWELQETTGNGFSATLGGAGTSDWRKRLIYSVVYLDAPDPHVSDIVNTSQLDVVKRMIDDALAVEVEQNAQLQGIKLLQESTVYMQVIPQYADMLWGGYDMNDVYHYQLNDQPSYFSTGLLSTYAAIVPASDNLPAGCNKTYPGHTGTWVNQVGVGLVSYASGAYWEQGGGPMSDKITYRQGAITMWGHSYGAYQPFHQCIDYEYEVLNMTVARNTGQKNAYSADAALNIDGNNGVDSVLSLRYTPGIASTATIEITSDNVLVLQEDAVTVATINITPAIIANIYTEINAAISGLSEWSVRYVDTAAQSRCAEALLRGASVAIGIAYEPTANALSSFNMIPMLNENSCIAEYQLNSLNNGRNYSGSIMQAPIVYGDPLYRPCGW